MNGQIADERRRLAGAEPPAAYVSYDARLLAGAGWYGYRIALKGGDRQMVELARYMLSERYIIRDGYEYYSDGVYVFGVLLRERVPHYGIGGGAPTPEPDALNFYMPNGGTISLNKIGSPTVVELEYSLDRGATWTVWPEDGSGNRSLTLTAWQRMYVRNTSETSTGFSTSYGDYYYFSFDNITYARGNVDTLKCKNGEDAIMTSNCYRRLFNNAVNLKTIPDLRSITLAAYCYAYTFNGCTGIVKPVGTIDAITLADGACFYMFNGCSNLETAPILKAENAKTACYQQMFTNCGSLKEIKVKLKRLSSESDLFRWVDSVASTGDFYCPAELTIPTGVSGIPSGWTRHDI